MATTAPTSSNTSMVKRTIGFILLLVGAWVTYDGFTTNDTLAIVLGVASLVGGLCFLFIRPRHVT